MYYGGRKRSVYSSPSARKTTVNDVRPPPRVLRQRQRQRQRGRLLRGLQYRRRRTGERATVAVQNKDERESAKLLGARRRPAAGQGPRRNSRRRMPDAEAPPPRAPVRRDARDAPSATIIQPEKYKFIISFEQRKPGSKKY